MRDGSGVRVLVSFSARSRSDAALDAHANEVLTRLPEGGRDALMAALGMLREVLQHPASGLPERKS